MTEDQWCLHPGLSMHWDAGQLVATVPDRAGPYAVQPELIPLLENFTTPCGVEEAQQSFLGRYSDGDSQPELVEQVRAAVRQFQDAGLVVCADGEALTTSTNYSSAATHILMLSDHARTLAYRDVLQRHAPGSIALEIGCGSGILSCFAALAGARHVYAIEESSILGVSREIVEANGLSDKITFIAGRSTAVEIPERVDLVFSELMGSDGFEEGIYPSLVDAKKRFLKPNGRMIPLDLSVWAVGVESRSIEDATYLLAQKRRAAAELGAAFGLDLSPLIGAYHEESRAKERALSYQPMVGNFVDYDNRECGERILTEEVRVVHTLLGDHLEAPITVPIEAKVLESGKLNAMLTYFKSRLDETCTLTTSPFAPQPLKNWRQVVTRLEPHHVAQAEAVKLQATFDLASTPNVSYVRQGEPIGEA